MLIHSGSTGASTLCAINRAGMYILLSILINLCALTYQLTVLIGGTERHVNKSALNFVSTAVPILLGVVGYALEVEIGEGENAKLNTVRWQFHCSSLVSFDTPAPLTFCVLHVYWCHIK